MRIYGEISEMDDERWDSDYTWWGVPEGKRVGQSSGQEGDGGKCP